MQNIVSRMTGANVRLISAGSNIVITINGTPNSVQRAVTLLYNYNACDWPDYYDEDAQCACDSLEFRVCKRGFIRGMLALVKVHDVVQWNKRDSIHASVKAIVRCAHQLREALRQELLNDLVIELA